MLLLAGWSPRDERRLATGAVADAKREVSAQLSADREQFTAAMTARAGEPSVVVGTTPDGTPYRLPIRELAGRFGHVTGGMGSGKSRAVLGVEEQLVRDIARGDARFALLHADWKGESADLLARVVAQVAAELPMPARRAFLDRVTYIRFFGPRVPEWQILRPEPGIPILTQAHALTENFDAVGTALGSRMSPASTLLFALLIENNLSLVEGRWTLYDKRELREMAARSSIPDARVWVETRLDRESAVTLDGLVSRCDSLLRVESVKAALVGPGTLELHRLLAPGRITIVSFGDPPLGAEGAVRALGSLFLTRFVWSIFDSRRSRDGFVVGVFDEVQESFTPATLRHLERLTTLGRSLNCGCFYVHQALAQLPPEAAAIFDANVSYRIAGRTSDRDARAISTEWIPRTGRMVRPRRAGGSAREPVERMSESEESHFWETQLTRLGRQHFVIAERPTTFPAQLVRAVDVDPPAWDDVALDVREAVLSANAGRPREEMLARAAEIETRAAARLTAASAAEQVARRRARDPLETPDVLGGRCRNRER